MPITALTCTTHATELFVFLIFCLGSQLPQWLPKTISLLQFRKFTDLCMMAFFIHLRMCTPTDLGHNNDPKTSNMLTMQSWYPQHQLKDIPNHRYFLNYTINTTIGLGILLGGIFGLYTSSHFFPVALVVFSIKLWSWALCGLMQTIWGGCIVWILFVLPGNNGGCRHQWWSEQCWFATVSGLAAVKRWLIHIKYHFT